VQLPFYIASSKAPHRVSRVAEKQLVRVWRLLCPFAGRVTSTACRYYTHVLQAVVHVFSVELRMHMSYYFALLFLKQRLHWMPHCPDTGPRPASRLSEAVCRPDPAHRAEGRGPQAPSKHSVCLAEHVSLHTLWPCVMVQLNAVVVSGASSWTALLCSLHREIAKRPLVSEAGAKMHFIDDRLETVKGIASDAALRDAGLRVYFAEWCASSQTTILSQWLSIDPHQHSSCFPVAALHHCTHLADFLCHLVTVALSAPLQGLQHTAGKAGGAAARQRDQHHTCADDRAGKSSASALCHR
jgi:hypothetical protein